MDIPKILAAYDFHERQHSSSQSFTRVETPHTVRYHVAPHRNGWIVYEQMDHLSEAEADSVIQAEVAWFRGRCIDLEWKLFAHSSPPWLADRLKYNGFEFDDESALMVLSTDQVPDTLLQPIHHDIRSKAPGDDLAELLMVLNGAFGGDHTRHLTVLRAEHQADPQQLSIYVGYVDGQPASCGWIRFPETPFASIWGGSTLPEYRGQGLYKALLKKRVQEAIERAYPYVIIDAGDMSRPIVEKHGFELLDINASYVYHYDRE